MCFGVYIFCVGADVLAFLVEVVGGDEAFIFIFIWLCLAHKEVLAQPARQLLLEKFMFGYQVVEPAVLGRFLVLFLTASAVVLIFAQKFIGVLLELEGPLLMGEFVVVALVVDVFEDGFLCLFDPMEEGVVDFDEAQHEQYNYSKVYYFY